jgi:type II secretion system protein C
VTRADLQKTSRELALRVAPTLALVSALLLLAWQLAQATWRLGAPAAPAIAAGDVSLTADLRELRSIRLFGEATTPAGALAKRAASERPARALDLVLTGVAARAQGGCALLIAGSEPEWAYCAGEEIVPGVRLEGVRADRVFILRNGAREVVLMRDATAPAAPRADARRVDRAQLREELSQPGSLAQALIVPNPGGGLLVRSVEAASVYDRLGLHAGDVIRAINGQPLASVEDVMRLYREFGNAERLAVEVQRGGRSETLHYEVR